MTIQFPVYTFHFLYSSWDSVPGASLPFENTNIHLNHHEYLDEQLYDKSYEHKETVLCTFMQILL